MWKVILILVATVVSVTLTAPKPHRQAQWHQNLKQKEFVSNPNQPQIDWDNYGNEGNGVASYPDRTPIDWNNEESTNEIGNGLATGRNRFSDCEPTYTYKDVPGMQDWCRNNCFHIPSFCPSSHCQCSNRT